MKRKNKTSLLKKIIKTLPVLLAGVTLVYLGLLLKDIEIPTMLPVKDVAVVGDMTFLDKDKIESIVKSQINGGYFTVDLKNIRASLLQQPWIKDVSLRRQWPATLDVIITEQMPVAYWNDDGYINSVGEVFKPEKVDRNLNLPKLNGPEGHHKNVWKFMNVLYQEMALLEFEVVRLDLDDRRSWEMVVSEYENSENPAAISASNEAQKIDVKLGRFETEKRLKRFVRILPSLIAGHGSGNKALANKNIKVIDMRYPNGFAVQMIEA
jgi:cell division protein FtsQ